MDLKVLARELATQVETVCLRGYTTFSDVDQDLRSIL